MPDYGMHLLLRETTDLAVAVNRLKHTPNSYKDMLQLMPQVAELIGNIHNWRPEPASVTSEYIVDEFHVNTIWRQGLLCFVYHEIYWLESSDVRIQDCVHASLASFRQLSWMQACLWPTVMIAVHCRTSEARTCYETQLRRMHTTLNFTAPLSIVLILENIWEVVDANDPGAVRWRDVVQSLGMELNILL